MNSFVFAWYLYFVSDDEEAIRGVWSHLVTSCRADRTISREALVPLTETRAPSLLNYCFSDLVHLYLFVFENYTLIEILFAPSSSEVVTDWKNSRDFMSEKSKEISHHLESTVGSSSLLIGRGAKDHFSSQVAAIFPATEAKPTDLNIGTLFRLKEAEVEWAHSYALLVSDSGTAKTGSEILRDFLTQKFPLLDLLFFKLKRETEYFREQQKTLSKERIDFDKEVSTVLHKEVVLTKAKLVEMDTLESEIGTLSRMYGMLASSRITIKQAHGTLDQDLRRTSRLIEDLLAPDAKENDLTTHYLPLYGRYLSSLAFEDELFEQSLENAKAAIDVVQTRVGLLRSGESLLLQRQTKGLLDQNILLQEEGVSLQAAASLIEFVIVFFYTLESWKALAEERIATVPVSWQFGLVLAFALSIVLCTHFAAKALRQKKKFSLKLFLAIFSALALIGAMAVVTYLL